VRLKKNLGYSDFEMKWIVSHAKLLLLAAATIEPPSLIEDKNAI
jgi:hypothetical protein